MKNIIFFVIAVSYIVGCTDKKVCDDNCKDEKINVSQNKIVITNTSKELARKLTTNELQKRKADVLSVIKNKIIEKKELTDGYSFKFENTDEMIDMLTSFVKSERQCCDFFNFSISVKNDGDLWFDLTGPKDAKDMIGQELGL